MINLLRSLLAGTVSALVRDRRDLALENLALRQQLAVYKRARKRPRLSKADRAFWVLLTRTWSGWKDALLIVKPDTVMAWHRKGFRLFWTWRSRRRTGRPPIDQEVRELIRKMSTANVRWGAPRIHGELLKLGIQVSQTTVAKYMVRHRKPPSPTWRSFLDLPQAQVTRDRHHVGDLVSMDFLAVPTATFRVLFVLVILAHRRRRLVHLLPKAQVRSPDRYVTANPTARWTAQQVTDAFLWDTAPRYLLRDRDGVYGAEFRRQVAAMGIEEVLTAPQSPWQLPKAQVTCDRHPFAERVLGSIRRELLDHVIVLNERHLRRLLAEYSSYYAADRTHLSLGKDAPDGRQVEAPKTGKVVDLPRVGGLHLPYTPPGDSTETEAVDSGQTRQSSPAMVVAAAGRVPDRGRVHVATRVPQVDRGRGAVPGGRVLRRRRTSGPGTSR